MHRPAPVFALACVSDTLQNTIIPGLKRLGQNDMVSRKENREVFQSMTDTLTLALLTEVFYQPDGPQRLEQRLSDARRQGAELAVLPELGLHPWSPATKEISTDDADEPDGRRHRLLESLSRKTGVGILGGTILRDPADGRRYSRALTFDAEGHLLNEYEKLHVPQEEGFWEHSHYDHGRLPLGVVKNFGLPFGVQLCSDVNRPVPAHILSAMGAEAILAPRATELATFPRWEIVFRAIALTACVFVVSVNRPGPERGVPIGGPSVVVAPSGEILLQTEDPLAVITLERSRVATARRRYPGYLPVRSDVYAREWGRISDGE